MIAAQKKEHMKLITDTSLYQASEISSLGKGIAISVSLSPVKIMQFTSLCTNSDLSNMRFFIDSSKIVFFNHISHVSYHVDVNT